jgi:hypothetical protein
MAPIPHPGKKHDESTLRYPSAIFIQNGTKY